MAPGSRLEELTASYMQNPRRYFVPLANEYRKAHELDRAIALCREHLSSQPGHMSGHIVLGRAYFEKGDLLAAREIFATSVELDEENLIALRHLGDIARARDEVTEALQWYQRVLDADPQNGEVAALVESLAGPATVDVAPHDPRIVPLDTFHAPASDLEPAPAGELVPFDAPSPEPIDLAALVGVDLDLSAAELPEALPVPQWPQDDEQAAATIADVRDGADAQESADASGFVVGFGFTFDDLDALAEPPALNLHADANDPAAVVDLELPEHSATSSLILSPEELATAAPSVDDLASNPGFGALASFASWRTAQARDTPSSLPVHATPAHVAPIAEPDAAPVFATSFADELASSVDEEPHDAGSPAPEFMTETMAVLYEQQGYTQQALDIYLALQRRAPSDAVIVVKIASLRQALAASTSQDSLQTDADKTLECEDLSVVGSLESDVDASHFAVVPMLADETLDEAFARAWGDVPTADEAGDDWFVHESDIESNADVFTESDGMFGIALGGFAAPDAGPDADLAATGAPALIPVVALAAVFGSAEIAASDAAAADLLIVLAAQMVGRLPKEAPTLPVPGVLELPASSAADSASGATPAPLLSFDRFFSGSGAVPRVRVDTPLAANRPSTPPAHVWPSLSPTFGGLPVVPPEGSDIAAARPSFDPDARAAAAGRMHVDPRASGPAVSAPASTRPDTSTPDAPAPVAQQQRSSPPSHDQAAVAPRLEAPAAPADEPPATSAEQEPPRRGPSSDFHRWLEGLS